MNYIVFFFFNDTATTEIYTLSLHDALPISIKVEERLSRSLADGVAAERIAADGGILGNLGYPEPTIEAIYVILMLSRYFFDALIKAFIRP